MQFIHEKKPFVEIRSSSNVLERIACAVKWNEAVLLVGETGTGKTTLVQNLATRIGQKLTVLVFIDMHLFIFFVFCYVSRSPAVFSFLMLCNLR